MRRTVHRPWNDVLSLRNGMFNSSVFTNGIDEIIFIFKGFYRNNFSTIIKRKNNTISALPISSLGLTTEAQHLSISKV